MGNSGFFGSNSRFEGFGISFVGEARKELRAAIGNDPASPKLTLSKTQARNLRRKTAAATSFASATVTKARCRTARWAVLGINIIFVQGERRDAVQTTGR